MTKNLAEMLEKKETISTLSPQKMQQFIELLNEVPPPKARLTIGGTVGIDIADEVVSEVDIIILSFQSANLLLEVNSEGKYLPICWSNDGKRPHPGSIKMQDVTCLSCKQNQWGSSEEGKGKACKNLIRIVCLTPLSELPVLFTLPPTSIKNFKQLCSKLLFKNIPYDEAIVTVTSHKEMKSGRPVTIADFKLKGKIKEEARGTILEYKKLISYYMPTSGEELKEEYKEEADENEEETCIS